jgi:PKD repeat protein
MRARLQSLWTSTLLASACALGCVRLGYDLLEPGDGPEGGTGAGAGAGAGGNDSSGGSIAAGAAAGAAVGAGGTAGASAGGSSGSLGAGGAAVGGPPLAVLSVTPSVGDTSTVFAADGSGSSDADQPLSELTLEWDWESDGTFDDSGVTASHSYASVGNYSVTLRVTDADGNADTASAELSVVAGGDLLVVTTGIDEDDAGASQAAPLGDGLSLREAIGLSNTLAGKQTIYVPADDVPVIDLQSGPITLEQAADLFGYGAAIEGGAVGGNSDCLWLDGDDIRVLGLEIRNCPHLPVAIMGGAGNQVADCYLHDNGGSVQVAAGALNTIGPGNLITTSAAHGIFVNTPTNVVGNTVRDASAVGIQVGGGAVGSLISRNLFVRGTGGIGLSTNADNVTITHNTVDSVSGNGIVAGGVTNLVLYNNCVTNSGSWGYTLSDGVLGGHGNNLAYGNGSGACSSCDLGAGSLTSDPLYVDPAGNDFRPDTGSPLLDAGFDLGEAFNGSAPDIGYYETL